MIIVQVKGRFIILHRLLKGLQRGLKIKLYKIVKVLEDIASPQYQSNIIFSTSDEDSI